MLDTADEISPNLPIEEIGSISKGIVRHKPEQNKDQNIEETTFPPVEHVQTKCHIVQIYFPLKP
ncbi:hypothetical protein SGI36_21580, partial [Providencia rettgeri]